jgi:hypothetical protein
MDIERLVGGYVRLRDKKAEIEARHKEELAPLRKMMDDIEAKMLQAMQESNATSFKTTAGTAYKTSRTSATVADRSTFKEWIVCEDAWEFADLRANKTAVAAYRDETGELPPGINWREELGVNFKRS